MDEPNSNNNDKRTEVGSSLPTVDSLCLGTPKVGKTTITPMPAAESLILGHQPKLGKATSNTVCFNVGGTHYETSRSLLEQHPNCMLDRLVSEEWNNSDNEPLFIERDGFRFRYILDYMRDGEVSLPPDTTSKDAFMKELLYFGFDEVPDNAVTIARDTVDMVSRLNSLDDKYKDLMQISEDKAEQIDTEIDKLCTCHTEETEALELRHEAEMEELSQRHQEEMDAKNAQLEEEKSKQKGLSDAFKVFQQYRQSGKLEGVARQNGSKYTTESSCCAALENYYASCFEETKHFREALATFGLQLDKCERMAGNKRYLYKLSKV